MINTDNDQVEIKLKELEARVSKLEHKDMMQLQVSTNTTEEQKTDGENATPKS